MTDILTDRQLENLAQEITLAFTTDTRLTLAYAMRKPARFDIQFIIEHYQALRVEHAALREIAAFVVAADEPCICDTRGPNIAHSEFCAVRKAGRALLGIEAKE